MCTMGNIAKSSNFVDFFNRLNNIVFSCHEIKYVKNTETTKNTCANVRVGYTWTAQTQCMVYRVYSIYYTHVFFIVKIMKELIIAINNIPYTN